MTTKNSFLQDEHSTLYRILNFRLHHHFKVVGITAAVLILCTLIAFKIIDYNVLLVKDVLRTLILFFLLVASLSKDKIEDEYNMHIRFHSFVVSFVLTAVYAILIPLLALILEYVISLASGNVAVSFYEISAFEILFSLLGMQLLFFETLKRFNNAQ